MWYQLHVILDQPDVDRVSALLDATGAAAVTLSDAADEALLEPPPNSTPMWRKVRATGMYAADTDMDAVVRTLRRALGDRGSPPVVDVLDDRVWEREWMHNFAPTCFGGRLWVLPSWCEDVNDADAVSMRLDPGLAFGTGSHETTALCLDWIARNEPRQQMLLDYGCGSGILAIAAAKLGAREVWAVDHDPQALTATRENLAANDVSDVVNVVVPSELPPLEVDVLLSNILAGPLAELAPEFATRVVAGGRIVLAGLLATQTQTLVEAYQNWFDFEPAAQRGDWVRLSGHKREVAA